MAEQTLNSLYGQQLAQLSDLTDKQKQILQASLELFSKQGFEATSTSQIAERAGVSTGLVYKKFPTKQDLLLAVLTPLFRTIPTMADNFVSETLSQLPVDFEKFVRAIVKDRMTFVFENQQALKLMLGQVLFDPALAEQVRPIFLKDLSTYILPAIEHFKAEKVIQDLPNDIIFQFLVGLIVSYLGRLCLDPCMQSLEEEIEYMSQFIVKGLKV